MEKAMLSSLPMRGHRASTQGFRATRTLQLVLERLPHDGAGRCLAGPDLKLRRGLLEEHLTAVDHLAALRLRALDQLSFARVVDHVEHQVSRHDVRKQA